MRSQQANSSETRKRSVVKGLVWRGLASLATFVLVFVFTHELTMAFEVSLLEVFVKLLLYYGHERLWNFITWGRIPATANADRATARESTVTV